MHARPNHILAGLMLATVSGVGLAAVAEPPEEITLSGKARDFRARNDGGHTDFEWRPSSGYGQYIGMIEDDLDGDGKPVMASAGHKLYNNWRDSSGRPIMPPRPHFPTIEGDSTGWANRRTGGALHGSDDFAQWFRDIDGINASALVPITLRRQPGTNQYVFDDRDDPEFAALGGFFPINNELYGNYRSTGKNFHFTFELNANFTYEAGSGQIFTFIGDDDVWVFVDGKCVIDIGGVHGAASQTINLDRLEWLVDGEQYPLDFFFAERHTTQSNFRIETTLSLQTVTLPVTTALFD